MKNERTGGRLYFVALFCLVLQMAMASCQFSKATPTITPALGWQGIVPGVSIETDVVHILGEPATKEDRWKYVVYSYPTPFGGMGLPNEIVLQDGIVRLVRVAIIEQNFKPILTQYGEPEKVTWSPSVYGGRLFIFASHGRAVVADNLEPPTESAIVEIWYFEQMPLERFLDDLAPIYVPSHSPDPDNKHPEDFWIREL